MALKITKENYEEVLSKGLPVVIDFWAEWCAPCRAIAPIVDELAEEYDGKVIVCKCDVADDGIEDIVAQYRVRNIPTLVFLKDGKPVDHHVGQLTKDALKTKIENLL